MPSQTIAHASALFLLPYVQRTGCGIDAIGRCNNSLSGDPAESSAKEPRRTNRSFRCLRGGLLALAIFGAALEPAKKRGPGKGEERVFLQTPGLAIP